MKKISAIFLSLIMIISVIPSAKALEHGAYIVYANTNYWNPDTGEIDDGGTANAALGEGMCRSATGQTALIEKDGDKYYVTIRLLLQSNTKNPEFWQRTGYNTYNSIKYDIILENGAQDSMDYGFEVNDPFSPIKASMYVVPMGRSTIWYIELDESTISTVTSDFIVSVKELVIEDEIIEEEITEKETVQIENDTTSNNAILFFVTGLSLFLGIVGYFVYKRKKK